MDETTSNPWFDFIPLGTFAKEFVEMKKKILEFIKKEDEDYFSFLRTLTDRKSNPFANSDKKAGWIEYWYPRRYMSSVTGRNCNIFLDVKEIDFTKFSWNFLKMYTSDDQLKKIIDVIDELNAELTDKHEQFRIKRLRINLFTTLNYVGSPFFDVGVYKKCVGSMYEAMEKLNKHLETQVKIISTTYDSVAFLGNVDYAEIRKIVAPADFKVREYEMLIHFRNLLATKMKGGEWRTKKVTGTSFDKVKERVVEILKDTNFPEAIMVLNKSDLNPTTKSKYIKDLVSCRNSFLTPKEMLKRTGDIYSMP